MSTRSRIVAATLSLVLGTAVTADIVGLQADLHAQVTIDDVDWDVWRLYATTNSSSQQVAIVAGLAGDPGCILTDQGTFYQHPLGLDTEHHALLRVANPDVEWDTYVTIGSTDSATATTTLVTPNWTGDEFQDDAIVLCNTGWFRMPDSPETMSGADQRVLVGQFTVPAGAALGGDNLAMAGPGDIVYGISFGISGSCDDEGCGGDWYVPGDDNAPQGLVPEGRFGQTIVCVGDLDLDGVTDYAVGAPQHDESRGRVSVHSGESGQVILERLGVEEGDRFGSAMTLIGDITGDGFPELAISAPYHDHFWNLAVGRVDAYDLTVDLLLWTAHGDERADRFGWSLAGEVDVDGDGTPDVIVGAPFNDDKGKNAGMIMVLDGETGAIMLRRRGKKRSDKFGWAVAGLPRGGADRFAVAAPWHDAAGKNSGRVYVFNPNANGVAFTIDGAQNRERFGAGLAAIGDLNGDGRHDLASGAPYHDHIFPDTGRVVAISGKDGNTLFERFGSRARSRFGTFVGPADDFDGDGTPDVIVGAPLHDGPAGVKSGLIRILDGDDGGTLVTATGSTIRDRFGSAGAGLGDLDDDDCPDFISGAPYGGAFGGGEVVVLDAGCDEDAAEATYDGGSRARNAGLVDDVTDRMRPGGGLVFTEAADLDADGAVDERDVLLAIEALVEGRIGGDVDRDGRITASDLGLILGRFGATNYVAPRLEVTVTRSVDDLLMDIAAP